MNDPQSLQGIYILMVMDQAEERQHYAAALEALGATVLTARLVDEALNILDVLSPDLVISELALPGKTGYDLIRAMREKMDRSQFPAAIPAIAVATGISEKCRGTVRTKGFQELIRKPFSTERLVRLVEKWTGKRCYQHQQAV